MPHHASTDGTTGAQGPQPPLPPCPSLAPHAALPRPASLLSLVGRPVGLLGPPPPPLCRLAARRLWRGFRAVHLPRVCHRGGRALWRRRAGGCDSVQGRTAHVGVLVPGPGRGNEGARGWRSAVGPAHLWHAVAARLLCIGARHPLPAPAREPARHSREADPCRCGWGRGPSARPRVTEPVPSPAGVVPSGPSGVELTSKFTHRETPQYKAELGNALVNVARRAHDRPDRGHCPPLRRARLPFTESCREQPR